MPDANRILIQASIKQIRVDYENLLKQLNSLDQFVQDELCLLDSPNRLSYWYAYSLYNKMAALTSQFITNVSSKCNTSVWE